jgi:hypothetical protein
VSLFIAIMVAPASIADETPHQTIFQRLNQKATQFVKHFVVAILDDLSIPPG